MEDTQLGNVIITGIMILNIHWHRGMDNLFPQTEAVHSTTRN